MAIRATSDEQTRADLRRLAYVHKQQERRGPSSPRGYVGGFQGAKTDRTSSEWQPGNAAPDVLHRMDARMLRERARDLVNNNPLARAAVNAYIANVIECGITPKPKIESSEQRKPIADTWEYWAENEADITGQQHFYELQALWLEEIIVGGGCLMHFVELERAKAKGRRQLLAIELIPEERIAEDADFAGKPIAPNGNRIVRGVEIDTETGKPLAYWIKQGLPNDLFPSLTEKPFRIRAETCSYGFWRTRIGQHRGFTLLAPVILYLWKLGYYTDNELMASAMRSCFGFVVKGGDGEYVGVQGEVGTLTDVNGNSIEKMEPGMIAYTNAEIDGVGPNTPPGDAQTWIKLIQRSIAVGMDISYFELMRDTADSNFAGFRAGLNADRKRYARWQDFAVWRCCSPAYRRWFASAVTLGLQGFPRQSVYVADPEAYRAATWRTPGWPSVAPLDDAKANEINIKKLNIDTCERAVGATGYDWEETMQQRAREIELEKELDIVNEEDEPALDTISSEDR